MLLASHQPDFLPYMGFFYKAFLCDTLVFSDDVLFSKKGMHNWNLIKTSTGAQKMTIPVHSHHDRRLCEIAIADVQNSIHTAVKTIDQHYRKAPHYDEGIEILSEMSRYAQRRQIWLTEFNFSITLFIMGRFGIEPNVLIASEALHLTGRKDVRIFQMCEEVGADAYLSGTGAADYHQPEEYAAHGIELTYIEPRPIKYQQLYGPFIPDLSVIDYVFNCGFTPPKEWGQDHA